MCDAADLDAVARGIIDDNRYMALGTADETGRPWVSPVYFAPDGYRELYWLSSPEARHSRNVEERPEVQIVIFDSTAPVGAGEAVYLAAAARAIRDDELEAVCPEAFRTTAGARRFTPEEVRGSRLRLYVAHATSCEVHVAGRHPVYGRGIDTRQPADPT